MRAATHHAGPPETTRKQPARFRDFPAFFSYTIVHLARIAVFSVYRPNLLFTEYLYWVTEALDVGLGILVIHEIYAHVFRDYAALRRFGRVLMLWCAAILVLVATVTAAGAAGANEHRLTVTLVVLDWCVALLKAALLLLLFHFSRLAGLKWRHYALGIAVGVGVYTSVDIAGMVVRTHSRLLAAVTYGLVKSAAYNCSALVWMIYFFSQQAMSRPLGTVPDNEMDTWNSILEVLLRRP